MNNTCKDENEEQSRHYDYSTKTPFFFKTLLKNKTW
jgi:hypothetical protein